jgi:hypothetical protein
MNMHAAPVQFRDILHLASAPPASMPRITVVLTLARQPGVRWPDPWVVEVNMRMHLVRFRGRVLSLRRPCIILFVVLLARLGGHVSRDELVDALWGDRADGGPDSAYAELRHFLDDLKPGLVYLGFRMLPDKGRTSRGVCVVPLPATLREISP